MEMPACLLLWLAALCCAVTATPTSFTGTGDRVNEFETAEGISRHLLARLLPTGPAPSICTPPCGTPVEVDTFCPKTWEAKGTDAAGNTMCLGPCRTFWQVDSSGQMCVPSACPRGYQRADQDGLENGIECKGCPPGYSLVEGIAKPGCYRRCTAEMDSYDTPVPRCCVECADVFRPGTDPFVCTSRNTALSRRLSYRRRCFPRAFASDTVRRAPYPRPKSPAVCPSARTMPVVVGGRTTCLQCQPSGTPYWSTEGRGNRVVKCKCGGAADCPPGYRYCEPYCWDANNKIIYQVLGPLNGGSMCSLFLEAISDACNKTCPAKPLRPVDPLPPFDTIGRQASP